MTSHNYARFLFSEPFILNNRVFSSLNGYLAVLYVKDIDTVTR